MDSLTHLKEALVNLTMAKLRSFLAILGILVGTASVVALMTSSMLATENALAQFKSLGTNLLRMDLNDKSQGRQSANQQTANLTIEQVPLLKQASPQVVRIAPYINLYQSVNYSGKSYNAQVLGATPALAKIAKIKMQKGRFVSFLDEDSFYCVIGTKLAQKLRQQGMQHLIGQQVLIGNWYFTIIGIAQHWQPNVFFYANIDKGVIVPIKTAYLLSNYAQINSLLIRLVEHASIEPVKAALSVQLAKILPNKRVTFSNPEQIIHIMKKQKQTLTWLLAAIGGISLLVGGIGVMNIMLVSVVERRREIGIRMAIGARQADIRRMFLIEAVVLTLFGGVLGIVVGLAISIVLAVLSHWGYHFYLMPPLLGFVVSVLVGIISGFYPAHRASKLDPIQTLQSD